MLAAMSDAAPMPTPDDAQALPPCLQQWQERIRHAARHAQVLRVRGMNSKAHVGHPDRGEWFDACEWQGVVAYEPSELVLTVRAGTPLAEVEPLLASHGQYLPFEPPRYRASGQGSGMVGGTVGGMVASGLSGPGRAMRGAVRDHVLGLRMFNGQAEHLRFGGTVMKNVAGFDLSRLMAGSMGTLGLLTEVSLKVMPMPVAECTLSWPVDLAEGVVQANRWAGQPLPVDATAWLDGQLVMRLRGAQAAVASASAMLCQQAGVVRWPDARQAATWWDDLRDQQLPFFQLAEGECLWRLSVPPTAVGPHVGPDAGMWLVEWLGGQRWWRTTLPAEQVLSQVRHMGGSAELWRVGPGLDEAALRAQHAAQFMASLSPVLQRWHQQVQRAFDPHGVFDTRRLTGMPTR